MVGRNRVGMVNRLTDDAWRIRGPRKNVADRGFDDRLLFFDDDEFAQSVSELFDGGCVNRVGHRHLEDSDAIACNVVVRLHAESFERLMYLPMGVARRDNANLGSVIASGHPVELVEADVVERDGKPNFNEFTFELKVER